MRTRPGLLVLCVLVAGCGGDEKRPPKPISGPAKEVAAVIERLETATAKQDFATICDDLLASATRQRAGGGSCGRVLGERARDVKRPRIVIESIAVDGDRATVRVRTTARRQAAASDLIRLERENGRFRIVSLG